MGFYYHFHDHDLHITTEKLPEAGQLLREYEAAIVQNGYAPDVEQEDPKVPFIQQIADANRWSVQIDGNGATISPPWNACKGDTYTGWLEWLAPVISDGGFIQISDDNDNVYRLMFFDGKCYQVPQTWPSKEQVVSQYEPRD
ncbi:MAG TPA: hypothetical protein VH593_07100 [Ktedonobacteraceae bacterium]